MGLMAPSRRYFGGMTYDRSHLQRKQTVNRNGQLTTVYVNPEGAGAAARNQRALGAATVATSTRLPAITDWRSMSDATAQKRFDAIVADAGTSENLWKNIDSLQGAFNSDKGPALKEHLDWDRLKGDLYEGWLNATYETDSDAWEGAMDELEGAWGRAGRSAAPAPGALGRLNPFRRR